MESQIRTKEVSFQILQERLLASVNVRIRNGEFSERLLARNVGISQSQLHNVLKGKRKLQTPLADALLSRLGISVLDLLVLTEPRRRPKTLPDTNNPALESAQQTFFAVEKIITAGIPRKQPASLVKKKTQAEA